MPAPHADENIRETTGKVTGLVTASGHGGQGVPAVYARIEFYMPEENANCFFHAETSAGNHRSGDIVSLTYRTDVADMCGSARLNPR